MNITGLTTKIFYQLTQEQLVLQTLERGEGQLNDTGAMVIRTGVFTGRSPADKFIVKDKMTENTVDWNKFNQPLGEASFTLLKEAILDYLNKKAAVWVRDAFACADPAYRLSLRIINEQPSANHFADNMFIAPDAGELKDFQPEWVILQAPGFQADPELHGTRQANFTIISFKHKTILIGGSGYTGEIKKGVFSVLNFILPLQHQVLSMHCSANAGVNGDTALFFGLSGTGKTTLSSDSSRKLIGDDEHGWDHKGVFNIEGGCYAKVINLSRELETAIFTAIRPGALVENTSFLPNTQSIDFSSKVITENTRVSYPLGFIKDAIFPTVSGHPDHIFFLACDAYGVLPPISRLNREQALYYFINGYTARIAGTEEGILEPQATFSTCFGAPFLPLAPAYYADLLQQKLETSAAGVWLVNTGWTGGEYGKGSRISLPYTRAMIAAVLNGKLVDVLYDDHPVFGVAIPRECPGIPAEMLCPWNSWKDKGAYFIMARKLHELFKKNYESLKTPADKV
ncbi:phosphoenolpyruvate carboxykinase (ATP) [Mucilaginibacter sp.]|uniref:phosphoenolpyruvate carboxykinase (ATP) n=1 Tax=Mucilaginibacter sp. TaxID=1882438 RepID=UPI003D0F77C5